MDEQTVDRIIEALVPVAEKLGQGAEFIYAVTYRQVWVTVVTYVALTPVFIVLALVAFRFARRYYQKAQAPRERYSYDDPAFTAFMFGLLFVALGGVALGCLLSAVRMSINPHYYAIDKILSTVTGG